MRISMVVVVLAAAASARADVLAQLPALSTRAPVATQVAQGRKLNVAALTLHRAKQYDAAIAKYVEALTADPSNTIARYNLASALASKGDTQHALDVLGQFRVLGCAPCLQRLRDARVDKEWKALWPDAAFRELVAFAESVPGGGPPAPIANLQLQVGPPDPVGGDGDDLPPELPEGSVRLHHWDEIGPGFYTSPALDIVARGPKGSTARTHGGDLALPGPGWWAIDVLDAKQVVATFRVVAHGVRCLGGTQHLKVSEDAPAHLSAETDPAGHDISNDDDEYAPQPQRTLVFPHEAVMTGDGAAVVEWRHGGKVVVSNEVTLSRDLDAAQLDKATTLAELDAICPLAAVEDRIDIPAEVAPGEWEVRIYERDAQAYAAKFTLRKGHVDGTPVAVKPIARPKDLAYSAAAPTTSVAAEVRAMLRSRDAAQAWLARAAARRAKRDVAAAEARMHELAGKLGAPFTDAELPVSASAPVPGVKPLRVKRLATPGLPAIAHDGSVLAIDQETAFSMYPGQCAPPAGQTIEVYAVTPDAKHELPQVASVDLSKLEPLRCGAGKLPGGLVLKEDELHAELVDKTGRVLASLDGDGGNGADACVALSQRVLVLLMHWPVGGDCSVVGGYMPYAVRY